jgi:Helix-turn-helix domain
MDDQGKLLLNEKEAAQLLSISPHFLRRDRISSSSVGIPYVRIGAAVRYRRADLEEWIARQMNAQLLRAHARVDVLVETPVKRGPGRPRKGVRPL